MLFSDFFFEFRDDPSQSLEAFVDLLILAATLGRTPGFDELGHLFEDFTGSNYNENYLL